MSIRIFDKFNPDGPACPLCYTKDELATILVPIAGTEDGNNVQAMQVHAHCVVWLGNTVQELLVLKTVQAANRANERAAELLDKGSKNEVQQSDNG